MINENLSRCPWAKKGKDGWTGYLEYHDTQWGVPVHDDQMLFEMLILEGAQAGLSWETVLKKRDAYRAAFDQFDPQKVARYDDKKVEELLNNKGIIRNRLKVNSAIRNAKAFLKVQEEFGSFDAYLWEFVEGEPIINHPKKLKDISATTVLSDAISKDLKKRGFNFVGSTIIYAYMQAIGMVDDHIETCFRKQNA